MLRMLSKQEAADYINQLSFVVESKSEKESEKWRRFYKSTYEYGVIENDGANPIYLEFRKPVIDNTIYYDDEQPDPLRDSDKKKAFVNYNLRNFEDFGVGTWDEHHKPYVILGDERSHIAYAPYSWQRKRDEEEYKLLSMILLMPS